LRGRSRGPGLSAKPPRKYPGDGLFSHRVTPAISLLLARFTTVFGMGTGGTKPPNHQKLFERGACAHRADRAITTETNSVATAPSSCALTTAQERAEDVGRACLCRGQSRSSPRPISTAWLRALLPFHRPPINAVFFRGSYRVNPVGELILGWASNLDAFSFYPLRTQLPGMCRWRDNPYTGGPSVPVLSY
jgi:hypothetical protein